MIERRFTLIDVMRGVKKYKLADRLSDGVYKFLIELILEANELGFKNPIDLTVKQALAIGGGESRQTLYNRRRSLSKILIDGKHLVKVKVGSYGQRSLATYDIGYELLCSYNGVWSKESQSSSNSFDDPLTSPLRSFDVPLDDPLPILRSEEREKRGDVGGDGDNFNWLMDQIQNVAPGSVLNDTQRQRMIEFSEAPREKLQAILQRFAERGEKRERLISWIDGGLRDWDRLYGGGNGGDAAHRAEWKRELDDMERELKEELADPHPDNVPWVKQTRERIANRRRMLNGGN